MNIDNGDNEYSISSGSKDRFSTVEHLNPSDEEENEDVHSQYSRLLDQSTDSLKYDPNQSFEERVNIRTTYSRMLKSIKEEKRKIASQPIGRSSVSSSRSGITSTLGNVDYNESQEENTPNSLKGLIEKADYVHSSSIKNIHDATFDSQLLKLSAEAGLASLEKSELCLNDRKKPFTIGQLTKKLDDLILCSSSLSSFGAECFLSSKAATFIDFTNGPITVPSLILSQFNTAPKRIRTLKVPSTMTRPDTLVIIFKHLLLLFRMILFKREMN